MSESRHLALFIRSLGANGAGAERIWLNFAAAFAARGHRVDLVLGRRAGHLARVAPRYLDALLPPATADTNVASRSATAG
jgi:hypothetical protein